ncbi:MAG: tetratricopeptide repeat protein [Elusimicrobia bacterium]|nr:tetratricopeptide repeat protein [Elusimicrobiota bacterium]
MRKIKIVILFFVNFLAVQSVVGLPQKKSVVPRGLPSVAVAVFENLNNDNEFNWLGSAFTEAVTSKLVYIKSIKVVERSQLKEIIREQELQTSGAIDPNTAVKIGKFLDIDFIIVGSWRKLKEELSVTAKIINIKTSKEENSVEVRGTFNDLFKLQDELIFKIAHAINTPVLKSEKAKIEKHHVKNLAVYEWYTKGADCYDKNEYDKSIEYYEKALHIIEKEKNEKLAAEVYVAIGNIYRLKKKYKKATEYCEKGLEVIEKVVGDSREKSMLYAGIAGIYRDSDKISEAIRCYNKSLEIIEADRKSEDENLRALILYNMAVLYGEQNEYKIALYFANKSLDIYQKIGDNKSVLDTQIIIKQFKKELGKEDR